MIVDLRSDVDLTFNVWPDEITQFGAVVAAAIGNSSRWHTRGSTVIYANQDVAAGWAAGHRDHVLDQLQLVGFTVDVDGGLEVQMILLGLGEQLEELVVVDSPVRNNDHDGDPLSGIGKAR